MLERKVVVVVAVVVVVVVLSLLYTYIHTYITPIHTYISKAVVVVVPEDPSLCLFTRAHARLHAPMCSYALGISIYIYIYI